jgi:hypothetical protein
VVTAGDGGGGLAYTGTTCRETEEELQDVSLHRQLVGCPRSGTPSWGLVYDKEMASYRLVSSTSGPSGYRAGGSVG